MGSYLKMAERQRIQALLEIYVAVLSNAKCNDFDTH